MDNYEENRINWIKIVVISSGELALTLFIFCYYPVISMLCFGEGVSSWLYSKGNSVGWAIIPIFIPTLINLRNVFSAVENEKPGKSKTFKWIELIVVVLYLPLIVIWYFTNGFRI